VTPLEAALHYAHLGWLVVPLHTPDDNGVCDCPKKADCGRNTGKHPRTMNGLEDATTDPSKITRWFTSWPQANIGIDLARSGLVDLAPDSIAWWAEFDARGMPPTLSFASGGGPGHEHHLYARTADCPIYRLTQTGEYDLLSAGYAVVPPSRHQSLLSYTWLQPEQGMPIAPPVVPQPGWATDMLRAKQKPPPSTATVSRTPGDPPVALRGEALERWYGRTFDTNSQTGQIDRSYSLWSLAVALLDAGCAPHFVEDLLVERDASLGWTKFSGRRDAGERYRIIVARAVQSQGPRRIVLQSPAAGTDRRNGTGHSARPRLVEWLTAAEIAVMEDEQITWYAHGLLGGGLIAELDGKVKQSGKTTLVLAMVRAILEGEPFLGQATTYTPIVYLTEQSGPSFKRNLRRAGLLGRNDLHVLLWPKAIGLKWDAVVAQAQAHAAEVGARILIVDTLGQFSGIRGDAENSAGTALLVMEPLQTAAGAGLAVLVSRHDRKSGGDVGDSGRGSSAYAGAVDIVLHLQRLLGSNTAGKERQRLLEGISRFEETPDKLLVELGPQEPHTYTALGDADVVRDQVLRRDILANLPTNPDDALSTGELKEAVTGAPADILRVLGELVREGQVRKLGLGKRGDPYRYYQRVYDDD